MEMIIRGVRLLVVEWWWWVFVNGFCTSVVLPGVLFFLILLLGNRIGRTIGLPLLMWVGNETWSQHGRQFLIGIWVSVLLWQVMVAGYLGEEFATNYTVDRPPFCEVRAPLERGRDDGLLSYLFWKPCDPPRDGLKEGAFPGRFRFWPTDLDVFWSYLLIVCGSLAVTLGCIYGLAYAFHNHRHKHFPMPQVPRILAPPYSWWMLWGLFAGLGIMSAMWLTLASPTPPRIRPLARIHGALEAPRRSIDRLGGHMMRSAGWWGHAAGRQAIINAIVSAENDAKQNDKIIINMKSLPKYELKRDEYLSWFGPYQPVFGLYALTAGLVFLITVGLALILGPRGRYTPAVWVLFFMHIAVFVSATFAYFIPISNQIALLCLVGWTVLVGRTCKHQYHGLDYGGEPLKLESEYRRMAEEEKNEADSDAASIRSEDIAYPLFRRQDGSVVKPPIALLCVSGGGSRAALWVMEVLKRLEDELLDDRGGSRPKVGFPYHIRLVTGASGGMLAAAAYAAALEAPRSDGLRPAATIPTHSLDGLIEGIKKNFLATVAQRFGSKDIWRTFVPIRLGYDRGWAIEEEWREALDKVLDRTFEELLSGEQAGWRPSLIFSPMLVEDGRQLFISNLSLRSVTQNWARALGEPDSTKRELDGRHLLSREGVELFDLFPGARSRFQVGTAARMSASFPYVLPAGALPTDPPRRVVDAGYYDVYGVGIAASWLCHHFQWVKEHTSGVVLIQIRDGESGASRRREAVDDPFPDPFSLGLQWATSPPEALWQSRVSSNVYRNDHLIHLTDLLSAQLGPDGRRLFSDDFFTTVTFEFARGHDVSLSWTLTDREIEAIEVGAGCHGEKPPGEVTRRVKAISDWWHRRLESEEARPASAGARR
jgi:hypothetical protein